MLASHLRSMSSSGSDPTDVEFLRNGCVGHAKLNRPKALNSLNVSMLSKLSEEFRRWEADDSVSLYLLSGNGGRAFCAGGDVRSLAKAATENDHAFLVEFFQTEFSVDHQLATLKKPLVALADGIWMGGGVGISAHAPVRVVTEKTVFAMPETGIGFFPDVGVTHVLSRMGNIGRFLALTGLTLRGHDVLLAGLATHFVPSDQMEALTKDLESVSAADSMSSVLEKYHADEVSSPGGEPTYMRRHESDIEHLFAGDTLQAVLSGMEEKSSSNEFARDVLAVLKSRCPLSMAVTWEQLQRNKDLSLHEVLASDYRLALRTIVHSEFREGIRAALVDKDKNPQWTSSLDSVDVDSFFAPMKAGEGFQQGN